MSTTDTGTDPNAADSDLDGTEVTDGTDPNDLNDPPTSTSLFTAFNSTTQDGGPNSVGGDCKDYNAGHEVEADCDIKNYAAFGSSVSVTPSWPDSTDNRVRQMIDRGAGNDANWSGTELQLVTDWLGIDTRTGNVQLTWNSKAGRTYIVRYFDSLDEDPQNWIELDDGVASEGDFTDFGPTPDRRFYVVEENSNP